MKAIARKNVIYKGKTYNVGDTFDVEDAVAYEAEKYGTINIVDNKGISVEDFGVPAAGLPTLEVGKKKK